MVTTILFSSTEVVNKILEKLDTPFDLIVETRLNGLLTVFFLSTMADKNNVQTHILEPISKSFPESLTRAKETRSSHMRATDFKWDDLLPLFSESALQKKDDLEQAVDYLLKGYTLVHLDGEDSIYTFDTSFRVKRPPSDPAVERTIRGSRISFVESFNENVSMIRALIKDANLRVKYMELGTNSKSETVILYLDTVADPDIVREVKRRMRKFRIDGILNSGYVEQLITDNRFSFFPLTESTERPDKVAAAILEGRVAIIVDGSNHAIIVPTTINELYQSSEDYFWGFLFGSFLRFFRIIGNVLALTLPGIYVALVGVNPELLPINFILTVNGSRLQVAFPLIIELLIMEIIIEIFREASLRLPKTVAQTLGVTTGIVLGIAAVGAGFVSNSTLVVVVITAIASFSGPNYGIGLSWRILKYFLTLSAAFLGVYGLTIASLMILVHAAVQNSFGVAYLSPWAPIRFFDLIDTIIRRPLWLPRRMKIYHPTDDERFHERGDDIIED